MTERGRDIDALADEIDPRQLILPYVDTSLDLANGRLPAKLTPGTAAIGLPGLVAFTVGLWRLNTDRIGTAVPLMAIGALFLAVALWGRQASSRSVYPHERLLDGANHLVRRLSLPWDYQAALDHADQLHGIEHLTDVGEYAAVETHDGRTVVPLRVRTGNTTMLDAGELEGLAGTLTSHLNGALGQTDVSIHSTTRPTESAAASAYQERADRSWLTRLSSYQAGLLGHIGEWIEARDAETGANDTQHYLCIETDEPRDIERVRTAFETVGSAEPLSHRDIFNLAGGFWEREHFPAGPIGESAARAVAETSAAERHLTPEWYDVRSRHVEVGESVAQTLWISDWRARPPADFLGDLHTELGVDLDVTVHAHARDRAYIRQRLRKIIPRIDAEGMERAEQMSVDSLTLDDKLDYYILAFKLLEETDTRPWRYSGYVTVRAPDVDLLAEATERVRTTLTSHPARCQPVAPFADQHAAFRSAAPFSRDHYGEGGEPRHRARKTHLGFGGVFGALLPGATADIDEPGGIRWGRDTATGRTFMADPYLHGSGPHMVTVGPTGSGKSFSVKQASQEWFMAGENRSLIYADTQGEFEDAVEGFDAEHIVIDGQTGINPFDIRPASAADQAATDGGYNQYRLKVDETTEFFAGILRNHGIDAADYHSTIERAVEQTFAEAGITTDPESHEQASPDPAGFFETLEDMSENPEAHTFTDGEIEATELQERVASLLNELSGFKEGGKYHHILEGTTAGIEADTDMAYIDMRQLAGPGDKSASLKLAVGQLTQFIRQTEGKTIFVVDEAHNLLDSPEMVDWLDKAAREWRRYDAALWFVTQSPKDFISNLGGGEAGGKQETILEQCSTIQLMNCSGVDDDVLEQFGVPPEAVETVQDGLVPGDIEGKSYSECVVSLQDTRGWVRCRVEASPVHGQSIDFTHRDGDSYETQMRAALDTHDND